MMPRFTQCAAPLVSLLLLSAGFAFVGTPAEAVSGALPPRATLNPWLNSPGQISLAEREKPEAGGRVIEREQPAMPGGSAAPNTSGTKCMPRYRLPAHC